MYRKSSREKEKGKERCVFLFLFITLLVRTGKKAELKYNDKFIHFPKQLPLPHRFYIYFFNRIHFWPMCYSPVSPDLTLSSARGLCKKYPSNFFFNYYLLTTVLQTFFFTDGEKSEWRGGGTGGARTLRCSFLSIFFFFG